MLMKVTLSGSILFMGEVDCVPPIGSLVRVETQYYKKGYYPGTILEFRLTEKQPPEFDFTEIPPVVYLDANGFTLIKDGPKTED